MGNGKCRFDQEKHKNETELFYFIQKAREAEKEKLKGPLTKIATIDA